MAVVSQKGGSSLVAPVIAPGAILALLAVGFSLVPTAGMSYELQLRLERSRHTIAGLAIGVACVLVGLLAVLAGR